VEWQNVAGRRAWDYIGYRHYGTVYQVGLGGRALLLPTPGARRFGFRVERAIRVHRESVAPKERPALETGHTEERRTQEVGARHHDELALSNSYVIEDDRRRFVEWMLEKLRAADRDPTALSYLDVGYEAGDAMELLSRAGCTRLTGLDLTPERLDEASRARLPGARWVQATLERHPFSRASFDVVVAAYSLHHIRDPRVFLSLVDELLRPEGWFFVLDFDGDALLRRRHTRRRAYRYLAPVRWLLRHEPANASVLRRQPPVPIERDPAERIFGFEEVRRAIPDHDRYRLYRESHGTLTWLVRDVVVKDSAFDRRLVGALRRADRFTRQLGPGYIQWIAGERRAEARSDP
jgi:SAM-dependent methyltransferase